MALLTKDKAYYKMALNLIVPISLQNALFLMVNLLDTVMLGSLGEASEVAINAANLANQPFFVFSLFIFGTVSGSSVLLSQYWGKKDIKSISSVAGIAIAFAFGAGVIFSSLILIFPQQILKIFSKDETVIALGADYLRIIVWCYIPTSMSQILSGIMRSVEKAQCALISNIIGLSVNLVLNYLLIFGKFGFPALGVNGAAIATVIARFCEFGFVIYYVFVRDKVLSLRFGKLFSFKTQLVKDFFKVSAPVIFNETCWSFGITMYSVIIGNLGTQEYAAYSVSGIIQNLALVFSQGFANAGAVIIGKTVGSGNKEKAYEYGKTTLFLSAITSLVCGFLIMLVRNGVVGYFDISPQAKKYASDIIFMMAIFIISKGYNLSSIVGILRGGGDTRFAMLIDVIPLWAVALPLGFLFAYVLHLPVHIVYSAFYADEIVKAFLGMYRFKTKKWIKDVTVKN
ncbi:MAG: MATE family efflux transporter [Ruminococcaceae bacterium]|nr:MATE family efflux transporter [Oscillospiraceae bacterium]